MNQTLHAKKDMTLFLTLFHLTLVTFYIYFPSRAKPLDKGDSRKFKLAPVENVKSSIGPTMDGGRLGVNRLIDGLVAGKRLAVNMDGLDEKNPILDFDSVLRKNWHN